MNVANGKTTRACDICIAKPAHYYCASDDAFLCQTCDSSVHSLARKNQRVHLKIINKSSKASTRNLNCVPSWHRGFTKKPRTPRHVKYSTITTTQKAMKQLCLVPEVANSDSHEENWEQVLYRVPNLDPFGAELCTNTTPTSVAGALALEVEVESQRKVLLGCNYDGVESENLNGFVSSDIESLLWKGLEEDQCMGMEELGLIDCKEEVCCVGSGKVKLEEEEKKPDIGLKRDENQVEMGRELAFELRFDYDSAAATCEKVDLDVKNGGGNNNHNQGKRKILLQLDYEAVISAWKSKRSPWTTGDKPDFLIHHCMGSYGMAPTKADGEREARVSRYREKRQTRLFSKKIRYEVRKLNAEKRPRIKGRFVKRVPLLMQLP